MNKLLRNISIFCSILIVTGCFGRLSDSGTRRVPAGLTLQSNQPTLVVFGATWCKPCRKEIDDLNKAQTEFAGRMSLLGLLVEGELKGSNPTQESKTQFVSPSGAAPRYEMRLDEGWKNFDGFLPPQGRALPFAVFVNSAGEIVGTLQESLPYESGLKPAIEAFLKGQNVAKASQSSPENPLPSGPSGPGVSPSPNAGNGPAGGAGTPAPARALVVQLGTWIAQELQNFPESIRPQNLRDSWERGLGEFAFSAEDMPFEKGAAHLNNSDTSPEGSVSFIQWTSPSNCSLTVNCRRDGSFVSARGLCQ